MVIVGHLFSFLMGKCQNESHLPLCRAIDFPTASFLHAGEVSNGSGRRAHGDIFPAGTVETTMTAGNRDKKCTPVRRATAATSGHTETYSTSPTARRARRRGFAMKMHAGKMKNGSDQRARGDIFYAPSSETSTPAGNRDEKCTPARRATARASGHTVAYSTPQAAKRPCRRGNGMKNARR